MPYKVLFPDYYHLRLSSTRIHIGVAAADSSLRLSWCAPFLYHRSVAAFTNLIRHVALLNSYY